MVQNQPMPAPPNPEPAEGVGAPAPTPLEQPIPEIVPPVAPIAENSPIPDPVDSGGSLSGPESNLVKKSPFRFLIPLILVLAIIGVVVFAITQVLKPKNDAPATKSKGTKTTQESVELTYWGLWEPSLIMEEVFTEFKAENPGVTIKYVQQSPTDYRERLQNALQSGQNAPDIFRFHQTWTSILAPYLTVIPSDVMTTAEFDTTFYPIAGKWLKSTKGYVGIPLMFDGLGLYYNQTIFDAAGKTPPATWDELRKTATDLTIIDEAGAIQRAGVALGTTGNVDHWPDIVGVMLLQNSADPAKPNNTLGQDALTFYTIFSTGDGVWNDTLPASTFAFATEKTAMMIAPSWRAHEVRDINPTIKFAIAPVPQLPDTNITWGSFWVEGVSAKSSGAKQQAAWKLVKYLSSKDVMRRLYTEASSERLFGEPFSRVDLGDQLIGDPYVGAYIKQAPKAQGWYLSSRTFDNGINDKIIKYYEDAINAVNQGEDVTKALTTTEQGITQVLTQYGLASPTR